MNTEGREQQHDFYVVVEQQQSKVQRGGGGVGEGSPASQDVVMEMSENFPDWSAAAAGATMRRVSFPNDKGLVTGYMEPADPWANGESITYVQVGDYPLGGQFCFQLGGLLFGFCSVLALIHLSTRTQQ